jgi:hypothetical protein
MHIEDLIRVEQQLGYRYELNGSPAEHYQWICPPCRRAMLVLAQGQLWVGVSGAEPLVSEAPPHMPHSRYGNPGLNQGPLGDEDEENFHP